MQKQWFIKRWFFQGLIVTLPIITTAFLLYYGIIYTDAIMWWVWDLLPWDLLPWAVAKPTFPGLGFLVVVTSTILIGALTESWLINKIIDYFNNLMSKLPFIRNVYSTVSQVAKSTFGSYDSFTKVVLIEYPRRGMYSLAFKTSESHILKKEGKYINVFLPTTPNPTSGFYLILPEHEIIETDLKPEQAFKLIISAGIVQD